MGRMKKINRRCPSCGELIFVHISDTNHHTTSQGLILSSFYKLLCLECGHEFEKIVDYSPPLDPLEE